MKIYPDGTLKLENPTEKERNMTWTMVITEGCVGIQVPQITAATLGGSHNPAMMVGISRNYGIDIPNRTAYHKQRS